MGKPVKLGGQARPGAMLAYGLGVGIPVLAATIAAGGVYPPIILLGGLAAGVVAVVMGPRRIEIANGRARVLSGFVRMQNVLTEGPIEELTLAQADAHRVQLGDQSVWLSERTWRRLEDALRTQRMLKS